MTPLLFTLTPNVAEVVLASAASGLTSCTPVLASHSVSGLDVGVEPGNLLDEKNQPTENPTSPTVLDVILQPEVRLRFLRKDPSACAEKVVFADLDVSADLPLGEPVEVTVVPPRPGEYPFTCQMQMYRGALIVR